METSEKAKKNDLLPLVRQFPKGHVIAASSLAAGLLFIGLLSTTESKAPERFSQPLALELETMPDSHQESTHSETMSDPLALSFDAAPKAQASPIDTLEFQQYTIKSGDSLSSLFKRAGLSDRDLYQVISEAPEAGALRRIMPGQQVSFGLDAEGQLQQLIYQRDKLSSLSIERKDGQFSAIELQREPDVKIAYRRATIDSSLFMAGQEAGITDNLTMKLAGIFGWDIDFILDIRRGDSFSLLYEEKFLDGEKIGNGNILAAEFTNRGKTYRAVRYLNTNDDANYYTPEGRSMRREFLRTPVEFTRISSPFNPNRRHPVLNTIRAHKGTDYAAPRGTPIRAAGDGRVVFAGRKGGYGNTVIIKHGQSYQTLYAHMNQFRRGVRSGSKVKQGQTIGYVGSSGLATGPHLHYEFHVNGSVRNPVTVDLPKASSIAQSEMERFQTQVQPLVAQLEQYQLDTQLAMASD